MSTAGDCHDEMRKPREVDDRITEAFVSGRQMPGEELLLASFAQSVRALATGPVPAPCGELARLLADGLTIEKGDLPVTAASKATGPLEEASGLPKWRRPLVATSTFVTALFTKVGMASAAAKVGLTAAVAAGAMTAAGAAGALPAPVQNALAHAVSDLTTIHLPTSGGGHPAGPPANPGSQSTTGLKTAGSTPAAGHAPTSLPTPTNPATSHSTTPPANPATGHSTTAPANPATGHSTTPPANPGTQSATGLSTAGSTPAAGHAPTSLPTPTSPGTSHSTTPPANPGTQSGAPSSQAGVHTSTGAAAAAGSSEPGTSGSAAVTYGAPTAPILPVASAAPVATQSVSSPTGSHPGR